MTLPVKHLSNVILKNPPYTKTTNDIMYSRMHQLLVINN